MTSLLELEQQYLALSPEPYPVSLGSLADAVEGCTLGMSKRDWIVTGPRGRVAAMLSGCSAERLLQLKDGARSYKIAPSSLSPANRALHAVGLALSSRRPVLCFLGIASAANGSYYEALNIAALHDLPVIFALIVQPLGHTPLSPQIASPASKVAKAIGIAATTVKADRQRIQSTVEEIRNTEKATLLEIQLEK